MHPSLRCLTLAALSCLATGLVAAAEPVAAPAAQAPAIPNNVSKQCESATGATRTECEKVARQMKSGSKPASTTNASGQMVDHSSPIMVTAEEKAVQDALNKGKDPAKAVEKIKKKNAEAEASSDLPKK